MSLKVVIIEDEQHAAKMLTAQLLKLRPNTEVTKVLDSVKGSLNWLEQAPQNIDLYFVDIELADGSSFEIFKHVEFNAPVIFTTAYDQYALDAFKVNAIHYLLKPIALEELEQGLLRLEEKEVDTMQLLNSRLDEVASLFNKQKKNRCLVKKGGSFEFISVNDIALAYSESSVTFLLTFDGSRHLYSSPIEQLLEEIDPSKFYQVNRAQLVNVENILKVHPYLGQRLKLKLRTMGPVEEVLVSRQRASDFKDWLDH